MKLQDLKYGQSVQIIDEDHDLYERMGKVAAIYRMSGTVEILMYNILPSKMVEVKPEQLAHIAN